MVWAALVPPVVGSLLLWAMAIALLPATAVGVTVPLLFGAVVWLCRDRRERVAVFVLAHAVPASPAELTLLRPSLELARWLVASPAHLYVRRGAAGGRSAEPLGPHALVLDPRIVVALSRGTLESETVAVVLAHAEARRRARGGMRHDVALRLVLLPGCAVARASRRIRRRLGWIPGVAAFRLIAAMVIATAIWRTFAQGVWWLALMMTATSIVVAAGRIAREHWRQRVEAAADHTLVMAGLGDPLVRLLRADGSPRSLRRIGSLTSSLDPANPTPVRHLRLVTTSPC